MAEREGADPATQRYVTEQWENVLPHEIAHMLLAARFFTDRHGTPAGDYGTPFPDWFDEAVAIWAESSENRQGRLAQAMALRGIRHDLRSILSTPHPAARDASIFAIRDGVAPLPGHALQAFYARAIAALAFVYDAGGRTAVRNLAQRLMGKPSAPEVLAGLPGLSANVDGVAAAWKDWFATGMPGH